MPKYFYSFLCTIFLSVFSLHAQDPVSWAYSAVKKGDKYEVHLKATIQLPWHLYSQVQPKDAIPLPTVIKFGSNPLVTLTGKAKEVGKKEIHTDASIGSTDWRYSDELDFVQTVTLKSKVKTNISGTITYQVCTDEKCLPPKTVSFNVKLD